VEPLVNKSKEKMISQAISAHLFFHQIQTIQRHRATWQVFKNHTATLFGDFVCAIFGKNLLSKWG